MNKDVLLKQIELFLTYLKKLNEQDLYDLDEGLAKISFVIRKVSNDETAFDIFSFKQYVEDLLSMTSREQCEAYFEANRFQKKDLEGILSCIGVSYSKKDNKEKLQRKIIENTIGKKLRTDAIVNK